MKILQQNINQYNPNVPGLTRTLLAQEADVIFLSEYMDCLHHELWTSLEENGYTIHRPRPQERSNWRNWLICIAAVKGGCTFTPRERSGPLLAYRYLEGSFTNGDRQMELFFLHAPLGNRPDYKRGMLSAAGSFLHENREKQAWAGGDFNTELRGGSTLLEPLMRQVYHSGVDTTSHQPTWRDKCLDYALVSSPLVGSRTSLISTSSDHAALVTEIVGLS